MVVAVTALPDWFLENSVLLIEDLEKLEKPLLIRDDLIITQDVFDSSNQPSEVTKYEVERIIYDPLLDLIRPEDKHADPTGATDEHGKTFTYQLVRLSLPNSDKYDTVTDEPNGGENFMAAVVKQFALDSKADLITLDLDNLDDLSEYLMWSLEFHDNPGRLWRSYYNERIAQTSHPREFSPSIVVSSPNEKRLRRGSPPISKTHPIVIHIPNSDTVIDAHDEGFFLNLLQDLGAYDWNIILLATNARGLLNRIEFYRNTRSCSCKICDGVSMNREEPSEPPVDFREVDICVTPVSDDKQKALWDTHWKVEQSHTPYNVRLLQRTIRRSSHQNFKLTVSQPFTNWTFLDQTETGKFLDESPLAIGELNEFACAIHGVTEEAHLIRIVLRIGVRSKILMPPKEDESSRMSKCHGSPKISEHATVETEKEKDLKAKWSSFPEAIRKTIKAIEENSYKYKYENECLSLLIEPCELEDGWSDIALEPEIKEHVEQLLLQSSNPEIAPYGILKRGQIGGALLYGPPGTGKTHLARVLAKESNLPVICASAADILSKWVGDNEKMIKGLFSLARMLGKTIIFIDEADALFSSRQAGERSWERSQKNQLLYEMDGLKKAAQPPFVLLATNFPSELDPAVLRRVPARLHVDLPLLMARLRIWKICLKDEILDMNCDIRQLAIKSRGYSGSDIQTVCVQAALLCDSFVSTDESGKKRLLKLEHFEKALKRHAPTVSTRSLEAISEFAKEYDPSAFARIVERRTFEDEEHLFSTQLVEELDITGAKTASTPDRLSQSLSKPFENATGWELSYPKDAPTDGSFGVGRREDDDSQLQACGTDELTDYPHFLAQLSSYEKVKVCVLLAALTLIDTINLQLLSKDYEERSSPVPEQFSYDPLDHSNKEIRLLELQPGQQSMKLSARIVHVSLRDNPHYETVSYCWGDSKERDIINLGGFMLTVPASSAAALRCLRLGSHNRCLWIDAICINQNDLDERASQVTIMGDIYSQSKGNLIYVGEAHEYTERVLVDISALVDEAKADTSNFKKFKETITDRFGNLCLSPEPIRARLAWGSLHYFFTLPWFSRLWVIQEAALAPVSTVHWGKTKVRWIDVLIAAVWLRFKGLHLDSRLVNLAMIHNSFFMLSVLDVEEQYLGTRFAGRAISNLLVFQLHLEATDPRDRIFALLGISKYAELGLFPDELQPDYNKSMHEVMRRSTRFMMAEEVEGFEICLRYVQHRTEEELKDSSWPSWVPRWYRVADRHYDSQRIAQTVTCATTLLSVPERRALRQSTDPDVLQLKGMRISKVEACTAVLRQEMFEKGEQVRKWIGDAETLLKSIVFSDQVDAMEARRKILGLALTIGANAEREVIKIEDLSHFQEFIELLDKGGYMTGIHHALADLDQRWKGSYRFSRAFMNGSTNRRFFTAGNIYGVGPAVMAIGDLVVLINGSDTPHILRQCDDKFRLVGQCFVPLLSQGLIPSQPEPLEPETFVIC